MLRCQHPDRALTVRPAHVSWRPVHGTSIEHVPTCISGNYIALLLYPLSTILNYRCSLLPFYTYCVNILLYLNVLLNAYKCIYYLNTANILSAQLCIYIYK